MLTPAKPVDKGSLSMATSLLALLVLTLIIESLSWLFSPQSFCGVTERVRSVNCSRPFFRAGAYTESDNALRLKKRSGNARLDLRNKWMRNCSSVEEVSEVICLEQFYETLPADMRTWVRDKKPQYHLQASRRVSR